MFKTSPYSEKKILAAVRNDGTAGWELFFSHYDPLIQSITGWQKWNFSEHEQQDVRQNIYVQLQTALPTFRQQCSLAWFVKKIAIRQCINEIRRQVRWRTVMTPAMQKTSDGDWNEMEFANPNTPDPYQEIVKKESRQILRAALLHLNKTCRDSIDMFYLQHLLYQEISEQLGISVNTVGSRLAKCLDKLHKTLRHNPSFERTEP
ncbi:MAG: sigma-70 family RNA polymerase sigma factor [Kiritimatiellales bacterium]|nr:sigma-70 family RNA polymerase sigma factor [Kiritimatiellales bacterium]